MIHGTPLYAPAGLIDPALRALFDAAPIPMIGVDDRAHILHANPFAEEMFGYGRLQLAGIALSEIAGSEDGANEWLSPDRAGPLLQRPAGDSLLLCGHRRCGTSFPLEIGLAPVEHADGTRFLITLVDLTVRKAAEARHEELAEDLRRRTEELEREVEQRHRAEADRDRSLDDFRFLFMRSPLPMWLYSPVTLQFVEANDAAVAQYGYTRAEFLAMTVRELHSADQLARMNEAVRTARGTLFQTLRNWVHTTKDGRSIEVDTYSRAFGAGEMAVRLVAAVDVTERNAAEAKLRQAQKMEAVGQLTGGIAHDFNNLLAIVLGNLELIVESCGEENLAVRSMAEDALHSVERGASLTRRLLAFSRQQPLEPRTVDVAHLVQDMAGLCRRSLGEAIHVQQHAAENLWSTRADVPQLENALLNLAVNARDAMPGGGKLTIEAQNAVLDADYARENADVAPGDYVLLAVSDSGTGMAPNVMEHVLEPFFTTKPIGEGTGLGLSMVYGFIKQSGGHIKIYSEPGHGTTVKLYLPRCFDAADAPAALSFTLAMPRSHRGETVLLVEDDANIRSLVERLLHMLGYKALAAADGPGALDILHRTQTVDLLLTDVVLPNGMSGTVLAQKAREQHTGLRVLYMSGYTRHAFLHNGGQEDHAAMLQKPFRKEELARAVAKALN